MLEVGGLVYVVIEVVCERWRIVRVWSVVDMVGDGKVGREEVDLVWSEGEEVGIEV